MRSPKRPSSASSATSRSSRSTSGNIWPRLGFDDDSPVVEVKIIYDGKYEQVNARGFLRVQSELVSKAWREGKDDLGWPSLHFIPKSEIGQRDPASV